VRPSVARRNFKILTTIPADQAFRPLADEKGTCGLVKTTALQGSAAK
jgi:branched-chain amino acid transport system substrate-binding protein